MKLLLPALLALYSVGFFQIPMLSSSPMGGSTCAMESYQDKVFDTNYNPSTNGFAVTFGSCENSGQINGDLSGTTVATNLLYVSPSSFSMLFPVNVTESYTIDKTCGTLPQGETKWVPLNCGGGFAIGSAVTRSFDTNYVAASDGMVVINGSCGNSGTVRGEISGTVYTEANAIISPSNFAQSFLVKDGQTWRAEATCGSPTGSVRWFPFNCNSSVLGSYVDRSFDTNYVAATDGFVVSNATCGTSGWLEGKVDSDVVSDTTLQMSPSKLPMTFPVPKGATWSIDSPSCTPSGSVRWISFEGCEI